MNVKESLFESVKLYKKVFFQLIWISLLLCSFGVLNELVSLGSLLEPGDGISILLLFSTLILWYLKLRVGMIMNVVVYKKISNTPISLKNAFRDTKRTVIPYVWNQILVWLVLAIPLGITMVLQSEAMYFGVKAFLVVGLGIVIGIIWSHVYFAPIDAQMNPCRKNHLKWSYQMVRESRLSVNLILFIGCFIFYAPFFLYNPMDFGVVVTPMSLLISGVIENLVFLFAMPFMACVVMNIYSKGLTKSMN